MATLTALKAQTAIKRMNTGARVTFKGYGAGNRLMVERTANGELIAVTEFSGRRFTQTAVSVNAVCDLIKVALGDDWQIAAN